MQKVVSHFHINEIIHFSMCFSIITYRVKRAKPTFLTWLWSIFIPSRQSGIFQKMPHIICSISSHKAKGEAVIKAL